MTGSVHGRMVSMLAMSFPRRVRVASGDATSRGKSTAGAPPGRGARTVSNGI